MAVIPASHRLLEQGGFAQGLDGFTARARIPTEYQATGIAEVDVLLGGGFPRGSLVELCGRGSSGRTSLYLALLAQATGQQQACALVDVSDSLDPMSMAATGVDLARLLWVRCGSDEVKACDQVEQPSVTLPSQRIGRTTRRDDMLLPRQAREAQRAGFAWQHPRYQMRGVENSIPSLVRDGKARIDDTGIQEVQTAVPPLAGTMPAGLVAGWAEEQVEPDRQFPRRGGNVRCRRHFPRRQFQNTAPARAGITPWPFAKPWKRLEQALKTTDLLLHSGGWGVVVLDLGNISWVDARRIPMSTWFRFQRIVENTPTILLLLGEEPCAQGCASLALRCCRKREKWGLAASSKVTNVSTFQGFEVEGELVRSRTLEPAGSARWDTHSLWSGSS
jgi:recombination protein RecA